jgi:hypothetical protein
MNKILLCGFLITSFFIFSQAEEAEPIALEGVILRQCSSYNDDDAFIPLLLNCKESTVSVAEWLKESNTRRKGRHLRVQAWVFTTGIRDPVRFGKGCIDKKTGRYDDGAIELVRPPVYSDLVTSEGRLIGQPAIYSCKEGFEPAE